MMCDNIIKNNINSNKNDNMKLGGFINQIDNYRIFFFFFRFKNIFNILWIPTLGITLTFRTLLLNIKWNFIGNERKKICYQCYCEFSVYFTIWRIQAKKNEPEKFISHKCICFWFEFYSILNWIKKNCMEREEIWTKKM